MAEWVHIEDNIIKGYYDSIPRNWRNISNLDKSKDDLAFLKSIGWLPVRKEYQNYDSNAFYVSDHTYEIRKDYVIERLSLSEIPPPTPIDYALVKQQVLTQIREIRNKLLSESDWTQLLDVQSILGEERKLKWDVYRQQLRDLPQIYEDTEGVINIDQVVWPLKPE